MSDDQTNPLVHCDALGLKRLTCFDIIGGSQYFHGTGQMSQCVDEGVIGSIVE